MSTVITTAEGTPLAWQQLGDGPRHAVLVHGLAANRAFWYAGLAQQLKAERCVTLYDLRGHGYSPRTPTGYSSARQAGDLLALMDGLGIEQADLIGHSYGGAIALEFAVRHPGRVRTLTMMDSRVNALQPEQWLRDFPQLTDFEQEISRVDGRDWNLEPQIGFAFMEAVARLRLKDYKPENRDSFTPFGEGRGGLQSARKYIEMLEQTTAAQDFLTVGAPTEAIAAFGKPALLLYGEYSRCLATGEALHRLIRGSRYELALKGGHFFTTTHAAWVARQVLEFLHQN